mgnify:CR=1 FL=1
MSRTPSGVAVGRETVAARWVRRKQRVGSVNGLARIRLFERRRQRSGRGGFPGKAHREIDRAPAAR